MTFAELYAYANGLPGPAVSVRALAEQVAARHQDVGEVLFYPVDLDTSVSLGHIVYGFERSSAYGEEFRTASIRFERSLNRCWKRFVCCKELMHVFDDGDQRTDSRDKFFRLMDELETTPPPGQRTPMYESEIRAQWMAMLVLCPETIRASLKPQWAAKEIDDYDVAVALRVPEVLVKNVMGAFFDTARLQLLGE